MRIAALLTVVLAASPLLAQRGRGGRRFDNSTLRQIQSRSLAQQRSSRRPSSRRPSSHRSPSRRSSSPRHGRYNGPYRRGYGYGAIRSPYGLSFGYSGGNYSFGYSTGLLGWGPYGSSYYYPPLYNFYGNGVLDPAAPIVPLAPLDLPPVELRGQGPLQPAERQFGRVEPKISNLQSRRQSRHFMELGDKNFGQQDYQDALQRYKSAAQAAADLAEPWFRQGHTLVALGKYSDATKAFARALTVKGDIRRNGFHIDALYGRQRIAKTSHLESLAKAALDNRADADALFLLGVFLYYDGQPQRAARFFREAARVGGANQPHLQPYLNHAPAAQPKRITI